MSTLAQARQALERLIEISEAESASIAADDIEAVLSFSEEKSRLQSVVGDADLESADRAAAGELRSLFLRLSEQDTRNTLELQRRLDDVKQERTDVGKLHEWSKTLAKTVGAEPGGIKDMTS